MRKKETVAEEEEHVIVAFLADSFKKLWSYTRAVSFSRAIFCACAFFLLYSLI